MREPLKVHHQFRQNGAWIGCFWMLVYYFLFIGCVLGVAYLIAKGLARRTTN
jgi:hypothetical protein